MPKVEEEKPEEEEELEEPLKVEEPPTSLPIEPVDKTKTSNLEDDLGNQLTKTQKVDLTDSGASTLHKHDHGNLDGKGDDDHTQYHNDTRGDARYLKDVVEDTTPQLGGDLDLNTHRIDFPTTPNISDCLDEDDMASDSPTKLATQQSIKAYANMVAGDPIIAGNVLAASADTERIWQTTTYTKKKHIIIGERGGTFTIKWEMKTNHNAGESIGRGKLHKNGFFIDGTLEETTIWTYTTYSHNIELVAFDSIELWINAAGVDPQTTIRNFRVYRNEWDYVIGLN